MEHRPVNTRITVVVLTYNRREEVLRTVAQLLTLPERPDVIVADNGSTDGTADALAARFAQVRVVRCPANLGAAGRNAAAALATTDYIAFSDDDTEWQPGSLGYAVALLERWPRVAVLSARVVVGDARAPDPTCDEMRASPLDRRDLPGPSLVGYMAGACVFRADVFRAVGGYEPRLFIGGEEELVALDVLEMGRAIVYCDQLTVLHRPAAQRDGSLRRRLLARNAALVAWLRLPWRDVARATLAACEAALTNGHPLADAGALLRGIGWAWRRRRVVNARVLEMRRAVRDARYAAATDQNRSGSARSYG
jgi:GT2 family glycosyltransferase